MNFDIYYRLVTGAVDHCGTTDNPKQWLKDNNEDRYKDVVCCDEYENEHEERVCCCFENIKDFEFKWIKEKK